ncbi:MAG TPA: hypothetical protein VFA93_01280 [Patescibacteria group bacterium]|nr:hypothetical protein [Patescibacteria group bacterium]
MTERPIFIHTNREGQIVGVSINPDLLSEPELHEFATRTLKHTAKKEELLFFRRGQGLAHVTPDDLLDLRLMFKLGDNPEILADGLTEEMDMSKRVTKVPARKTATSS